MSRAKQEGEEDVIPDLFTSYFEHTRHLALHRDGYKCTRCDSNKDKLHVCHIIPRRLNGPNTLDNLWTLCTACHGLIEVELRSQEQGAAGGIVAAAVDDKGDDDDDAESLSRAVIGLMRLVEHAREEGYCTDNDWISRNYLTGLVLEDFLSEKEVTTQMKIAAYREPHKKELEKARLGKMSDVYLTNALYIAAIIVRSIRSEQIEKMMDKYRKRMKQQQLLTEAIK
jgi:hypothetical protein